MRTVVDPQTSEHWVIPQGDIAMNHQARNLARTLAAAAALVALALLPHQLSAEDLTSASFLLRGGTLSGGGEVDLVSTAPVPSVSALVVTIGQSSPLGVSTGPSSGTTLETGFWPTVPVPEPGSGVLRSAALVCLAFLAAWKRRRRGDSIG